MVDFYRIKFLMSAKESDTSDFLAELITSIKIWLEKRYGSPAVERVIPSWNSFCAGGIFGNAQKIGGFSIETVSNTNDNVPWNRAWACSIIQFPPYKTTYIPRKWITEIGYLQISAESAEISYSVKYDDLDGYQGKIQGKPIFNIPNVVKSILTSNKWECSIGGHPIDVKTAHHATFHGTLFGMSDCLTLNQYSVRLLDSKECTETTANKRWISLCKVNRPDKNKDIWLQRLADSVGGTLIAPVLDETKEQTFDNRLFIFREDGPKDSDNIGFWEWGERKSKSGRWFSDATYVEQVSPIEIVILDGISSIEEVVETLKTGLHVKEYVRRSVLFAVQKDSFIEGILCDLNDFNTRSGKDVFVTIKENICTLPYYKLSEQDIFTWKTRKVYKYISLNEPKRRIPVYIPAETIKQMFLQRISKSVFQAHGISNSNRQKFTQFLNELPKDSILERLSEIYEMSHQEAEICVDSFLKTVENYMHTEDIDSTLVAQLFDSHEGLKQKCEEFAYERWQDEHKTEVARAKQDIETIRTNAEQEEALSKQRLSDIQNSIYSAKAEYNKLLSEIAMSQNRLDQLHTEIAQCDALGNDTLEAVRQKIFHAQKDMANFIADLSVFLPQTNGTAESKEQNSLWKYSCVSDYVYSIDDIELADNWDDEFNTIRSNLKSSFSRVKDDIHNESKFFDMLTAFLYAAHINNIPLLIAGPCGQDIADFLSVSLYAKSAGKLTLGNGYDYNMIDVLKEYEGYIVVVQNMFGKGWSEGLPQEFFRLKKQVIWTHPYVDDMVIEPKGLYNYMIPILSESFVRTFPVFEPFPGKRTETFKEYVPKEKKRLRYTKVFKRLGLSNLLINQLELVLSDAKDIINNPAKEKDMEILLGLIPLCVLTGRVDILKETIETEKNSLANEVKEEAERFFEEE